MSALVGFFDTKTGAGGIGVAYYSLALDRQVAIQQAKELINLPFPISWQEFYGTVHDEHETPNGSLSLFAREKEERYFSKLDADTLGSYLEYIMSEIIVGDTNAILG